MKIKPGVGEYKLPKVGEVIRATLDEGVRELRGHAYALMPMPWEEICKMPVDVRERPLYFCHVTVDGKDRLWLRPIPDKKAEVRVRFFPPMREV